MEKVNTQTRIDFLLESFKRTFKKGVEAQIFLPVAKSGLTPDEDGFAYDPGFAGFASANIPTYEGDNNTPFQTQFKFFLDCDPTKNKEYVHWFLNIYRDTVRDRISEKRGYADFILSFDDRENFFEDMMAKATDALETYTFLKKTNTLAVETRDINRYKTINEFVNMVKPYMISSDEGDDSVHTLNHREMQCIRNFVDKTGKKGQAELVYEDSEWVIVITHDKEANNEFGKYTTWCTAGTRFTGMFDSYHNSGELFVLIKKGFGAKKMITKHPDHRLQFHFGTNGQFMNALDKSININEFLFEHKSIKSFFRDHIVKYVMPVRQQKNNQKDDIQYLMKLGFGGEIIKIFIESKPTVVDFSKYKIEAEYLDNIGQVTSIRELILNECGLNYLPESVKNLKNLEILKFRDNKDIKEIPAWLNEMSSLVMIDCADCDIQKVPDLSNNKNLTELVLDFNVNLNSLPPSIGNLTALERLTAAKCAFLELPDELRQCTELFLVDVHECTKLKKMPILSDLWNIQTICIDDTAISKEDFMEMQAKSNGMCNVIRYGG